MEMIAVFWPLLKIFSVFLLMVFLLKAGVALQISMLCGAAALGVFFLMPLPLWPKAVFMAVTDEKALYLSVIVGLILVFSDMLDRTGQSNRLMDALSVYLRKPAIKVAFFPALIGLLPMPGGAYFSAPMLKSASDGYHLDGEILSLLNYWFRHIWELTWPLYPVVILTCHLSGMSFSSILALTWPSLALSLVLGRIFYLRPKKLFPDDGDSQRHAPKNELKNREVLRDILIHGLPVFFALVGALVLENILASATKIVPPEAGFLIAMLISIVICAIQNRVGIRQVFGFVFQKHVAKMLILVFAIFIFKSILENCGAISQLGEASNRGTWALFIVATLFPFLVGMISGISMAYAGTVLPLVLGILSATGLGEQKGAYIVLVLFSGFTGVMFSPLHVCLILTCEFFHASLIRVWKRLILPCAMLWGFGLAYFFLLKWMRV